MSSNIKRFLTGLGIEPVSADPSNPVQGQLQYADGTVRAEGLWRYDGTAWQQVGSGAGSYDIFYQENLETNTASNFTTGQNASPDAAGTGTLGGALANEESSQISGDRSLKYTMNATAASSDNDFFLNDTDIALDIKQRGNFIGVTFYYTYSGADDDIRFFVLDQDDNELTQSDEYIKAASTAQRFSTSVFLPSDDTAIRYGFQVVTGNSSKVFIVDDIEFSTNPFVYKNLSEISSVQAEGTAGQSISADTTNISFTEVTDLAGAFDGTTYTVQRDDSIVSFKASVFFTASTNRQLELYLNGTRYKKISDFVGTDVIQGAYISGAGEFAAGDLLTLRSRVNGGTTSNDTKFHYLNIEERWEAEHVVTPAKAGTESYYGIDHSVADTNYMTFATETSNLSKLLSDTSTTHKEFTVLKDCIISASITTYLTGVASDHISVISINNDDFTFAARNTAGAGQVSATFYASAGDVIAPKFVNGTLNTSRGSFSLVATPREAEFLAAVPVPLVAEIKDVKTINTSGGSFTSGAWRTRDLNTVSGDAQIISLSSNEFTLPPGKYSIEAYAPAYFVGAHISRLYNVTDSVVQEDGSSEYAGSNVVQSKSVIKTTFTITSSKTFRIEHRCITTNATNGFGFASNITNEVYTQVRVVKIK